MVRLLNKNLVEINPGEIIEEIVIEEEIFFFFTKITTYRKVHGEVFRYKEGRYKKLSVLDWEIKYYFELPLE